MSIFLPQQTVPLQGTAVRRAASFNIASRKEKSLSASISYTTAPPRMFTSNSYTSAVTGSRRSSRVSLTQQPWYHNVDRSQGEVLLRNGEDGSFLVRPSARSQNALTLMLWFNKRLYNINIRHRNDGRYALGTEKPNEQSFNSVEELVQNYQSEKLVLYSGGERERTGRTLLTSTPLQSSELST
ncbi:hypothetical protein ANN_23965 [Periplaneta americana]|uniref:SH2 domain-containing protein n=1 Tax=Periplaneta americana TaxID=6978 RepID=A0ABQ8S248_PERAM|nr:hypothetical protein ANN_23965 [Periplaneta americana]